MTQVESNLDVVIVGGGLAGLWTAKNLVESGIENITVVEPRTKPSRKSLFIQGMVLERYGLYQQLNREETLHPIRRYLMDYPHQNKIIDVDVATANASDKDKYFAINEQALLSSAGDERRFSLLPNGVKRAVLDNERIIVSLNNGKTLITKKLVDATGSGSPLSRYLIYDNKNRHLPIVKDDPIVMWCHGERAAGKTKNRHALYHPASPDTGSASWILPNSDKTIDVIASGFCRLSELKLVPRKAIYLRFLEYCIFKRYLEVDLRNRIAVNGFIRVQPIGPASASFENIFIIGDSAGMGSPVYGEVIPAILRHGQSLAEVIKNKGTALEFYNLWRRSSPQFPYDAEQAALIVKNDISRRNRLSFAVEKGAGSNSVFYEKILQSLPRLVQKEFLLSRKLPVRYIPRIFLELVSSREALDYLRRFFKAYLYVRLKERNAQEQ